MEILSNIHKVRVPDCKILNFLLIKSFNTNTFRNVPLFSKLKHKIFILLKELLERTKIPPSEKLYNLIHNINPIKKNLKQRNCKTHLSKFLHIYSP